MTQSTSPNLAISAAAKAGVFIGQDDKLETVRQALTDEGTGFRLVLVQAQGGMGKSRLLEEVMARVNHPDQEGIWAKPDIKPWPEFEGDDRSIVSAPIDVIDTRLHDRNRFISALHSGLRDYPEADFPEYRRMEEKLQLQAAAGVQLQGMRQVQDEAAKAFIDDLTSMSKRRRIGLLVDTAERLSYPPLDRLRKLELLSSDKFRSRTHVWLESLIANHAATNNITLVLAGRAEEGEFFFRLIREAATQRGIVPIDLDLKELDADQTRQFYLALKDDYELRHTDNPNAGRIAGHFAAMAGQANRLHHYTGGVPVRLSLYGQIIIEGGRVPALLALPTEESRRRAPQELKIDAEGDEEKYKDIDEWIRWTIEDRFILELVRQAEFRPEDAATDRNRREILRARVLQALLRAPRGLSAEQLHFALDNYDNKPPEDWKPNAGRLREYITLMHEIEGQYLGKRRSSWSQFTALFTNVEPAEAATYRIGLQDEIYRVYGEHMGPLAAPVSSFAEHLRGTLSEKDKDRFNNRREGEYEARRDFYRRLAQWSDWRLGRLVRQKNEMLRQDETDFGRDLRFDQGDIFKFKKIDSEAAYRSALNAAIVAFETERMVYDLLDDPEWTLNTSYITLEDDNDKAGREEDDFLAQAEMLRVIQDDFLMKFVHLTERKIVEARNDKPLKVLRRVAEQENVSRWIKRLALRGDYKLAIEFAGKVQAYIDSPEKFVRLSLEFQKPKAKGADSPPNATTEDEYYPLEGREYILDSWRHTVTDSERLIWRTVPLVRQGKSEPALDDLLRLVGLLRERYESPRDRLFEVDGRKEYGFRAVEGAAKDDPNRYDHPGRARLKRLLSHTHNIIGFAYTRQGDYLQAIRHYATALAYIQTEQDLKRPPESAAVRRVPVILPAHRAKVLNNLSRAFSEIGLPATEICKDGMALRRDVGEEVPLAGSLNTLALIYDDMGRYEEAAVLSAKSVAYCRRTGESRQQALSLRQLAESLRHLAQRPLDSQRLYSTPESYYTVAADLLTQAHELFTELGEGDRLPEIMLEQGSLNRDRMENRLRVMAQEEDQRLRLAYVNDDTFESFSKEALIKLENVLRLTEDRQPHLALDAHVCLARVHKANERYRRRLAEAAESDPTHRADRRREEAAAQRSGQAMREQLNQLMRRAGRIEIRVNDGSKEPFAETLPRVLHNDYRPAPEEHDSLRNNAWVFRHLCRAWLLRGAIALDEFESIIARMKQSDNNPYRDEVNRASRRLADTGVHPMRPISEVIDSAPAGEPGSAKIARAAARAVEAYALAVRLAELFSPRTRMVDGAQNAFYDRARKYNPDELALLDEALQLVGAGAPYENRVESFGLLRDLLLKYFGYGLPD